MSRGPYDPPVAPVDDSVAERAPARWRWLYVPFGHTVCTFILMTMWALLATNFLLQADEILWNIKEAVFQGAVILVITTLILWAVPRILVRHAVYVALASGV